MNRQSKNKKITYTNFEKHLAQELKDPIFRKYYDEYGKQLEIAYQILQLRKQMRMSQAELAKKIGTKQSNIARMESGQQNFTTEMLQKIAIAFNRDLKVEFVK
ncbi:helix-turn-helix domain-containing protein [Patescibacteria group bacterium AH-259-L05]|nr:helix-turn-helix domain-containing protein [Patescibacteria group bacterium AH-259-L05]